MEAQRQAKESAAAEQERIERIRLEALRQKSCRQQSAVASPEVKRHLQEFVKKNLKRKEAASSMSNLKLVPNSVGFSGRNGNGNVVESSQNVSGVASSGTGSPHGAILRKTASESNLLKMKPGKRSIGGAERGVPYSRLMSSGANPSLGTTGREPSIPEASAISIVNQSAGTGNDSLQGSPGSTHSASSFCSIPGGMNIPGTRSQPNSVTPGATRPPLARDLSLTSTAENYTGSSAPNSPKVTTLNFQFTCQIVNVKASSNFLKYI